MRFLRLALLLGCLAFGGCSGEVEPEVTGEPTRFADWDSAFVEVNGLKLHYWRTGNKDKPAIILAHGITDYGLNWASLAEHFEEAFDIIMYDARGHGFSDKPEGPYTLASHAEDLAGLIAALQVDQPILMGHSMGGSTVALLAATQPGIPRAVILEDPADMLAPIAPMGPDVAPDWKRMIEDDKRRGLDGLAETARKERHPGWTDRDYRLWAESKLLVAPNVVDILEGEGFGDARQTYPAIQAPTLILKADAAPDIREKDLEIGRLLPNGRLVHIEGAGHVIRNDRPEEVVIEVRRFLSELE